MMRCNARSRTTRVQWRSRASSARPPAPVADFTLDVSEGNDPLDVTATNLTTGEVTSWLWEKNDGGGWVSFDGTPTDQDPDLETLTEGTWSIRLTATGPGGSHTKTLTDAVVVYGPLFQATFTGANGTNLSGYSPEVGGDNATLLAGTRFEIQSNRAASVGTEGVLRLFQWDTLDAVSDFVLTGTASHHNGYTGFWVRGTDLDNGWVVVMAGGAFTQEIRIFKKEGGSLTSLANQNVANSTATLYLFTITCNGSSIALNFNSGAASISYGSATFQQTAAGFGLYGANNADRWDSVTAWRYFA